jgi:N-acetylglutamate synthase-like GNAT family acetyltransferase
MYVRDAKNREEVWLLDHIEEMGLDDTEFRSRDYVLAVDEESDAKAGFGRVRVHKDDGEAVGCELTSIGVLERWREQGVGAHVVERLVERAADEGFDTVYALTGAVEYLDQFGFEPVPESDLPDALQERLAAKRDGVDPDAVPVALSTGAFEMPADLRERFKSAAPHRDGEDDAEPAEDFGIDTDSATYKYDTGG